MQWLSKTLPVAVFPLIVEDPDGKLGRMHLWKSRQVKKVDVQNFYSK